MSLALKAENKGVSVSSTVFAIAGVSGAGKSTLAAKLVQRLERAGLSAVQVCQDRYYRDFSHLPMAERAAINFDHPDSFDFEALERDLARLKAGGRIERPPYDYTHHRPGQVREAIGPAAVIVVEGILILHRESVRQQIDASVYLDEPLALCLERRIARDCAERGRSRDEVVRQFERQVSPMFERYGKRQSRWASDCSGSTPADELAARWLQWVQNLREGSSCKR